MMTGEIQMIVVLGVIAILVVGLITDKIKPHILFLGAALFLMIIGILTPKVFLGSFANESLATIFVLILLTAALNANFNILKYLDNLFTQKRKPKTFLFQLTTSVTLLSSVMNNTPIVSMLIPYVLRWSKKQQVSPSKLLIPLSYAAITGGMITNIGTSTNLVLNGFMESKGEKPFGFFDFLVPGLLVSAGCIIFLTTFGYYLLRNRKYPMETVKENLKEYLVEISLSPNSAQIHKTVHQAGLRNLQGVYLVEILRNGRIISPVSPEEILEPQDRLFFAGDTSDILEIVKEESGFQFPKTNQFNLQGQLEIVEALIPYNSILSGKTLKESNFREKYDAAVIAIHRNGERLRGKLGEIRLSHGDLLMLTAGSQFSETVASDTNLYKLGIKDHLGKVPAWKSYLLLAVSILSILGIILAYIPFFVGISLILATFFALQLMSEQTLWNNLNLDLFIILGSAIALGTAFIETGGAKFVADEVMLLFSAYGNMSIVIGLYLLTVILTAFITNAAAISIVFPVAYEISHSLSIAPEAVFMAIAFAASCSFITPFGYQTNLMVYGPGGYKFSDFLRIGFPMTLIYSVACLGYIFVHYQI